MAGKDISEKILFSNNDVFADLVNGLLFEGKQVVLPEELSPDETITQLKIDGDTHLQDRDIAKTWTKNGTKIAILGVENQTRQELDMVLRALAYDVASCKKQVVDGKASKHYVPCPVVTMVLYFGDTPWTAPKTLSELYDKVGIPIPTELKPYINDYKLNVFEIAFLDEETVNMFKSDFRIVADYFVQRRTNRDYIPDHQTIKHIDEMLMLLSALTSDRRFKEIVDTWNKSKEGSNMCEVLDKVENRGIEKGVREGRKQGEINGGIKMLVSLVRDETLSITKAAAKAKMTQEEFKRIMDKYPEEDA